MIKIRGVHVALKNQLYTDVNVILDEDARLLYIQSPRDSRTVITPVLNVLSITYDAEKMQRCAD